MAARGVLMGSASYKVVIGSIAAIPAAFYGYAFLKAWISLRSAPAADAGVALDVFSYGITHAAIAFCLALLTFVVKERALNAIVAAAALACQLSCAVILALALYGGADDLLFLQPYLGSVGVVAFSALWVNLYAKLNPVRATFLNAASIVLAQAFVFVSEESSAARILVMLAVLPLLSAGCAFIAVRSSRESGAFAAQAGSNRFLPVRAILFVAACSFAYRVASSELSVLNERYISAIPALVVLVLLLVDTKRFSVASLFRMVFPLMLVGFLLVALLPGFLGEAAGIAFQAGYGAMSIMVVMLVCTVAYGSNTSGYWLFGVLAGTQFLATSIGSLAGTQMAQLAGEGGYTALCVVTIVAVVFSGVAMMAEKDVFSLWGVGIGKKAAPRPAPEGPDSASESSDVGQGMARSDVASNAEGAMAIRINALAASHGLTDREVEVLFLAARGKTNNQIGRDMFISQGTVKAHMNHIYRKLEVHSRKELAALVGVDPESRVG